MLRPPGLALAILILSACALTGGSDRDADVPVHRSFQPPESVTRLAWTEVAGYDGTAHDFLLNGDTLIVLDATSAEVAILVHAPPQGAADEPTWRLVRSFGRPGDGPGEFKRPTALALADDGSIQVWSEAGRLYRFSIDGELLEDLRLRLPCMLFRSAIASDGDGLYVAGQCASGGAMRDTVYARAFEIAGDSIGREVAAAPVATMDFSWGSMMTALRFVTEGERGVVFATGLDGCLTRLGAAGEEESGVERTRCTDPPARYRSEAPPSFRNLQLPNGTRPRWPDPITPLIAHIDSEERFILQPISDDSLVVTPWASGASPLLVGPTRGFVGCRREHCLWFNRGGSGLALVNPRLIAREEGLASAH